jgi:uncharacterized protein YuzE
MVKITYDPEVNITMIYFNKEEIVDSDIQDNCVIDYSKSGKIVSIEILDFNLEKSLKSSKKTSN